ncbi:hypothetical protein P4O66_022743 [Electrophorus voltai]|uniref:Mitochondrial ribosomal protein S36 n=2 Tax=Electrophorus TaxID=8004 RepID=A0A4W4FCI5_ELEEL|nr:28S ribosomal protein S36, mitochondrial [Electrophorus electricus]XP_026870177.1 28S ribosomal protein S36, mitochondrial [Electrophorus electricus]KAK1801481.1 hypothetical protein P4O66_022743 [Electrophorus voltai]
MGSSVSRSGMAAARAVQAVRPHVPLITFPNRQGLAKPNVQEALKLLVASMPQTSTPSAPAQAATGVGRTTGAAEWLSGSPDSVAVIKQLPQKYRRRALLPEEMDYIQRGGPE